MRPSPRSRATSLRGTLHQGCGVNVDQLVKMKDSEAFREIIGKCDLVTADGTPVVWASRLFGKALPERVAGIDLFEALLPVAAKRGYRVYLLGAKEESLQAAGGVPAAAPRPADRRRAQRLLQT
jgi:N-acetylglucosaminyldiphosphoundecaprenol N-acetyl-beta-D-mannosaminyltransferase